MTTALLEVPKWLIIIRGIQILFSVIVLALSAYGVYWIAFNAFGFAIFTSLATIILVLYNILSTRIASLQKLYNQWAVLGLDCFAIIFWLSAMASLAAVRGLFVIDTYINGCGHTGEIGGGYCYKRDLSKRQYFASHGYLNVISVAAGFSGLNMILFIVTLVFTSRAIHRRRMARKSSNPDVENGNNKVESHGMETVQQPPPPASHGQTTYEQQQAPPPASYGQPTYEQHQGPPPPADYRP